MKGSLNTHVVIVVVVCGPTAIAVVGGTQLVFVTPIRRVVGGNIGGSSFEFLYVSRVDHRYDRHVQTHTECEKADVDEETHRSQDVTA